MSIDKKMSDLEKIAREMENSNSFDKSVENFTKASCLVKEILSTTSDKKGKILEIIKDIDAMAMVEREIKNNDDEDDEC